MRHSNNILTIPNFVTLLRLLSIPLFIYLMLNKQIYYGLIVYLIAVLTDIIDGNLARHLQQESKFGKIFDPFVDFCIIISSLIVLYLLKYINLTQLILFNLPRIITFFISCMSNRKNIIKGDFIVSNYSKTAAVFTFILITFLILKLDYYIILITFMLVYLFSILHWYCLYKNIKRKKFESLVDT